LNTAVAFRFPYPLALAIFGDIEADQCQTFDPHHELFIETVVSGFEIVVYAVQAPFGKVDDPFAG